MPTRKKALAVVEAPPPEAATAPWDEAGWDADGEDSSADQDLPEATETLEELMAEVDGPLREAVAAGGGWTDEAINAAASPSPPSEPPPEPPQPDPPPEPRGFISLLIAPGPDRCGAVVSLDAPDLDSGEWRKAKFRTLDNFVFTPEGGNPDRTDDDQLEQLAASPIRFLFHGKIGVLRWVHSDPSESLCIVPHAFDLAGVGVNSPNGWVFVRAVDGEIPVLEIGPELPPEVS
jgi:hypothetical protein